MGLQRLVRADWQSYCERISHGISAGQRAELEIVSLDIGDHLEARWMPIVGLVYEPKTDLLEVALEGVDHLGCTPARNAHRNVEARSRGRGDRRGRRRAAHRPVTRAAVFTAARSGARERFARIEHRPSASRRVAYLGAFVELGLLAPTYDVCDVAELHGELDQ